MKRDYVTFDPRQGYPAGEDIYYECAKCGDALSSKPDGGRFCSCRNIAIDVEYGRVLIRDPGAMRVFSKSHEVKEAVPAKKLETPDTSVLQRRRLEAAIEVRMAIQKFAILLGITRYSSLTGEGILREIQMRDAHTHRVLKEFIDAAYENCENPSIENMTRLKETRKKLESIRVVR